MSFNGAVVTLTAGEYRATVAAAGATIVSLTHRGRDLIRPFDPDAGVGLGWEGRTLAPWPSRITNGAYTWDGVDYELPRTEHERKSALHGLAAWSIWSLRATRTDAILRYDLPAQPWYPFDIVLTSRMRLDRRFGLLVALKAENHGQQDAPVALGVHPYLTSGGDVEACTFSLPATSVVQYTEDGIPAGRRPVTNTLLDFRRPTLVAGRRVDHAFTGLPSPWSAILRGPDGYGVRLFSDAPWAQVFSADGQGRDAMAVEPMTSGPDALNADPAVRLAPWGTRELRYAISVA